MSGQLQHSVNLVSFEEGKISLKLNESISSNFVRDMSNKLSEWTGKDWIIESSKEEGEKSLVDQQRDAFENEKNQLLKDSSIAFVKEAFPNAEIVKIEKFTCNNDE